MSRRAKPKAPGVRLPREVAAALRVIDQEVGEDRGKSGLWWHDVGLCFRYADELSRSEPSAGWSREALDRTAKEYEQDGLQRLVSVGVKPSERLRRALAVASLAAAEAEEAAVAASDALEQAAGGDWPENGEHALREWLQGNLADARAWRLAARQMRRARRPNRSGAPVRASLA